ncbi:DUF190 domain-containing protein [Acidiphilium acidophilum]|nr:DUF190 domain-containing protein [Acidiphilium acidophilum]
MLRIFLGEDDTRDGRPLYRLLLETAMQHGLAGRGFAFGICLTGG